MEETVMLGDRKQSASTTVYAFDDKGKKLPLSRRDFGARNEERLGSNVQGLGLPPPTQFIVVPQDLLSAEQVLLDVHQEKRTLEARLRLAKTAAAALLRRAEDTLRGWWWLARVELGKLTLQLRNGTGTDPSDENWSCDATVILDRERPLSRSRALSPARHESVG